MWQGTVVAIEFTGSNSIGSKPKFIVLTSEDKVVEAGSSQIKTILKNHKDALTNAELQGNKINMTQGVIEDYFVLNEDYVYASNDIASMCEITDSSKYIAHPVVVARIQSEDGSRTLGYKVARYLDGNAIISYLSVDGLAKLMQHRIFANADIEDNKVVISGVLRASLKEGPHTPNSSNNEPIEMNGPFGEVEMRLINLIPCYNDELAKVDGRIGGVSPNTCKRNFGVLDVDKLIEEVEGLARFNDDMDNTLVLNPHMSDGLVEATSEATSDAPAVSDGIVEPKATGRKQFPSSSDYETYYPSDCELPYPNPSILTGFKFAVGLYEGLTAMGAKCISRNLVKLKVNPHIKSKVTPYSKTITWQMLDDLEGIVIRRYSLLIDCAMDEMGKNPMIVAVWFVKDSDHGVMCDGFQRPLYDTSRRNLDMDMKKSRKVGRAIATKIYKEIDANYFDADFGSLSAMFYSVIDKGLSTLPYVVG